MYTKTFKFFALSLLLFFYQSGSAQGTLEETANALAVQPGEQPALFAGTSQGLLVKRNGDWEMTGLEGKSVIDIVISPSDPQTIYAVTDDEGLYKSVDGGNDWTLLPVMVDETSFVIQTISIDSSNPLVMLAASSDGFLLKSEDAGMSWSVINPDFPLTAINAIALHPTDEDTIFVGTGGNGIFKSSNGGSAWVELNDGLTDLTVTRLLINNRNPSVLYAGTYGGGVFKTSNGGKSWASVNEGLSDTFVYSLAMPPAAPAEGGSIVGFLRNQFKKAINGDAQNEIYAGVFGGAIYKSTANGDMQWSAL